MCIATHDALRTERQRSFTALLALLNPCRDCTEALPMSCRLVKLSAGEHEIRGAPSIHDKISVSMMHQRAVPSLKHDGLKPPLRR